MKQINLNRNQILTALDIIKFILVLALVLMFMRFNAKIAENTSQTRAITQSTNSVVKGQRDILAAIKAVTDDTHATAAHQTAIIICMLQVPVNQRTTDLQQQCRNQVNVADANNGAGTGRNSGNIVSQPSSSQPTTSNSSEQSDSSQTPPSNPRLLNCKVDVLFLHIGC